MSRCHAARGLRTVGGGLGLRGCDGWRRRSWAGCCCCRWAVGEGPARCEAMSTAAVAAASWAHGAGKPSWTTSSA